MHSLAGAIKIATLSKKIVLYSSLIIILFELLLHASMPGKCSFYELWLLKAEYQSWIEVVPSDVYKARCKFCRTILELPNMGESALKGHMKCKYIIIILNSFLMF